MAEALVVYAVVSLFVLLAFAPLLLIITMVIGVIWPEFWADFKFTFIWGFLLGTTGTSIWMAVVHGLTIFGISVAHPVTLFLIGFLLMLSYLRVTDLQRKRMQQCVDNICKDAEFGNPNRSGT